MRLWFWFGTSLVISSIDFEYVVSAVVFRRVTATCMDGMYSVQ